jgi:VWFA-related protein
LRKEVKAKLPGLIILIIFSILPFSVQNCFAQNRKDLLSPQQDKNVITWHDKNPDSSQQNNDTVFLQDQSSIFSNGASSSGDDVIRIETELVTFEVVVTDKSGKPVTGLQASDFQIFEDGVERGFDFFEPIQSETKARPLCVVLAVDVSGSITGEELQKLQFILSQFTERLVNYKSYFTIMTFGMKVKTILPFTNNPEKIKKSLLRLEHERDGLSTHAYDAVDEAIRLLQRKTPKHLYGELTRRVVVLITDGFPVGDVVSPKTVIERANDAGVTIYSVILPSYSAFKAQKTRKPILTPLEASGLMERTGGKSFYPTQEGLEAIFRLLADEIKGSYLLAFYPSEESKADGKLRVIQIKTKGDYLVRQNRIGYQFPQRQR